VAKRPAVDKRDRDWNKAPKFRVDKLWSWLIKRKMYRNPKTGKR